MNSSQDIGQTKKKEEFINKDGVNIQVVLRCRPPNKDELSYEQCIKTISKAKEVIVTQKQVYGKPFTKNFNFDHVYGPNTTQKELFESVKPLVEEVLMGYNCNSLFINKFRYSICLRTNIYRKNLYNGRKKK